MHEKDEINCCSVGELIELLSSPDHFDRAEAARQLCNMGKDAIEALPVLLSLYNDPWYQVRIQVPRAIIHMGTRSDEATGILHKLLDDEDEIVRLYAKEAQRVISERT